MDLQFDKKESFKLINEMILSVRNDFHERYGTPYIFWGILVAFTALLNVFVLVFFPDEFDIRLIWWVTMPLGWIVFLVVRKKQKKIRVAKTYASTVVSSTWTGFFFCNVVIWISFTIMSVFNIGHFGALNDIQWFFMCPIMLLLVGIALYISGVAIQSKMIKGAAFFNWILAFVCLSAPVFFENRVF